MRERPPGPALETSWPAGPPAGGLCRFLRGGIGNGTGPQCQSSWSRVGGVGRPPTRVRPVGGPGTVPGTLPLKDHNRVGRPVPCSLRPVGGHGGAGLWEFGPRAGAGTAGRFPVTETSWPHGDRPWDCRFEARTGDGDGELGPSHPGRPVGRGRTADGRPGSGSLGSGDWDRSTLEDQLVRGRPRDRPTRSGRPPRFEGGRGTGRDQIVRTGPDGTGAGRMVGQRGQNVRTRPVGELVQQSRFRPPAKTLGRIKLRKTVPVPPTSTSWLSLPDPFPAMF